MSLGLTAWNSRKCQFSKILDFYDEIRFFDLIWGVTLAVFHAAFNIVLLNCMFFVKKYRRNT